MWILKHRDGLSNPPAIGSPKFYNLPLQLPTPTITNGYKPISALLEQISINSNDYAFESFSRLTFTGLYSTNI